MSGRSSPAAARPRAPGSRNESRQRGTPSASGLGSRLSRLRATHGYRFVLALIFGAFVFTAVAPDTAWAGSVLVLLQCGTLVAALRTSGVARADSRVSLAFGALAVTAAIVNLAPGGKAPTAAVALLSGGLVVMSVAVISLGIVDQSEVNRQTVRGAICVYVLLGMLFVFVYGAVATLGSGPFFAQGTDGTRSLRLYFSYVTLATLGYGDYTPAGDLGHTAAVLEALVGQLYLVTVLALLVSRLRSEDSD